MFGGVWRKSRMWGGGGVTFGIAVQKMAGFGQESVFQTRSFRAKRKKHASEGCGPRGGPNILFRSNKPRFV